MVIKTRTLTIRNGRPCPLLPLLALDGFPKAWAGASGSQTTHHWTLKATLSRRTLFLPPNNKAVPVPGPASDSRLPYSVPVVFITHHLIAHDVSAFCRCGRCVVAAGSTGAPAKTNVRLRPLPLAEGFPPCNTVTTTTTTTTCPRVNKGIHHAPTSV